MRLDARYTLEHVEKALRSTVESRKGDLWQTFNELTAAVTGEGLHSFLELCKRLTIDWNRCVFD